MRCDYAQCQEPGSKKAGPWLFCGYHFEADKSEAVGAVVVERAPSHQGPSNKASREHGTIAMYHVHRRACETPCAPCRKANTDAERDRRQRKAAAKNSATPADVCRVDGDLGTACWAGVVGEAMKAQQATPGVAA